MRHQTSRTGFVSHSTSQAAHMLHNVTVQKLNQTGALTVTDMKEHFWSPWRAQDPALCSSSAIQERDGLAEGKTQRTRKMVRAEGEKIQEKDLKNVFEIRFSLRDTKEKHDKDRVFLQPQLKAQWIRPSKAERSYRGGKIFSVTKPRATMMAWTCCGLSIYGEYAGQAC